jgi:hypothetical protein
MAVTGSLIETAPYHNGETGGEESHGLSSPPVQAAASRLPTLRRGRFCFFDSKEILGFRHRNEAVDRTLARLEQQSAAEAGQIASSICALRRRTC